MKKYTVYKSIQLVLLIALTAAVILIVFPDADVFHRAAADPAMRTLLFVFWGALVICFIFIFLDFTYFFGYLKDYKELEYASQSDPVSGIANRFSCDMLIEQYLDKPLPENMGCMMIDLTSIRKINELYGHIQGNMTIRDFSNILRLSSESLCFVGRNGGNRFLAIFEDTTEDDMSKFLERVSQRVIMHNRDGVGGVIEFEYGYAFHEDPGAVKEITQLISLANSRLVKKEEQRQAR